jgi:hypothetical protein
MIVFSISFDSYGLDWWIDERPGDTVRRPGLLRA